MGMLTIKCPSTGRDIPTGIAMDKTRFKSAPVFFSRTYCAICRTNHEWFAKDAWVGEASLMTKSQRLIQGRFKNSAQP